MIHARKKGKVKLLTLRCGGHTVEVIVVYWKAARSDSSSLAEDTAIGGH